MATNFVEQEAPGQKAPAHTASAQTASAQMAPAQAASAQAASVRTALGETALEHNPSDLVSKRVIIAREVIRYGGRQFSCTPEMARIFLKHAREVIERGESELVPLLHSGGIELLLISRATPYSLIDPEEP